MQREDDTHNMTHPITYKVGFDNAGGVTLEVPEYKWSLHTLGDEALLARTISDLHDGAVPDDCWTNQWDEGVRAEPAERVVAASDLYDLVYRLRSAPGNGSAEELLVAALEALPAIKAVQTHGEVEGYNDFAALSSDEREQSLRPSRDGELADAGYINGIGTGAICKAIGVAVSQWEDVRFVWCEAFLRGRERAINDWQQEQE